MRIHLPIAPIVLAAACQTTAGPTLPIPDSFAPQPDLRQAGSPPVVSGELNCVPPAVHCGAAVPTPTGYRDETSFRGSAIGDCTPTWTLRGCLCLPLSTLWDFGKTRLHDNMKTVGIESAEPIRFPLFAASALKRGETEKWQVWHVYYFAAGSQTPTGAETPGPLAAAEVSMDYFQFCPQPPRTR